MNIPVLSAIFQGIPESTALVFLTLVFLRVRLNWGFILFFGVLQTAAAFLIRMLPLAFGVHSVVLILVLSVFMTYATKLHFIKIVPNAIIAFIVLLASEFLSFTIITKVFNLSIDIIAKEQLFRILVGLPHVVLMFFVGLIIIYFRKLKEK